MPGNSRHPLPLGILSSSASPFICYSKCQNKIKIRIDKQTRCNVNIKNVWGDIASTEFLPFDRYFYVLRKRYLGSVALLSHNTLKGIAILA